MKKPETCELKRAPRVLLELNNSDFFQRSSFGYSSTISITSQPSGPRTQSHAPLTSTDGLFVLRRSLAKDG